MRIRERQLTSRWGSRFRSTIEWPHIATWSDVSLLYRMVAHMDSWSINSVLCWWLQQLNYSRLTVKDDHKNGNHKICELECDLAYFHVDRYDLRYQVLNDSWQRQNLWEEYDKTANDCVIEYLDEPMWSFGASRESLAHLVKIFSQECRIWHD